MALRPWWKNKPFELVVEASFTGRVAGANYDLAFPFALNRTDVIYISLSNLKVYDAAPNDIQSTNLYLQYNGSLYSPLTVVLANTRSTIGDLTSYVDLTYRPLGYDPTDMHYTIFKYSAYGTSVEGALTTQDNITVASPENTTITGIRLNHSGGFITNQANIKVYRLKP